MTPSAEAARVAAGRHHEHRVKALLTTFRQLRHDLASPLSGAALHLEMAARRIAQRQDPELAKIAENVKVSQQEVTWASAVLDLLGELARSADDILAPFSLREAVRRGAQRHAPRAEREGVRLHEPTSGADAMLFGARDRLEQAVSDLTAHALSRAPRGTDLGWTIEAVPGGSEAAIAWPKGDERPDRAFVLTRRRAGEAPDAGLFLARWAVEGLGGTLSIEAEGERFRARARFRGEESA